MAALRTRLVAIVLLASIIQSAFSMSSIQHNERSPRKAALALRTADAWLRSALGMAPAESNSAQSSTDAAAGMDHAAGSPSSAFSWLGGMAARRRAQLLRTCADGSLPTFNDEDVGVEYDDNPVFGMVVASFFLLLLVASIVVFCGIAYRACTAKDKPGRGRQQVGISDLDNVRTVPTVRVHE